ncbi:hypothetical protein Cgig2_018879 [Carnegiea gigantea]|uniref:Transcription factor MYB39 n=1 Tax=Carnegiea gigantea TaxID=171969 RepID=A0A9Q1K8Z1_9CARY|nr:hypothetical protein Cgig2_018879 [Carnegiea gigantea]
MGRAPCCEDTSGLKKGPWTPEEDEKLTSYIQNHGHGSWRPLPKAAGLNRCGKSCRLRWTNYLRPNIKRGRFTEEEEDLIIKLHSVLGNKWSRIAAHLPGRTDNEIKNYWNTHLRKKLLQMGIDPITHKPRTELNFLANLTQLLSNPITTNLAANLMNPNGNNIINNALGLQPNIAELARLQVLQNIYQILNSSNPLPNIDQPAAPLSYLNGLGSLNPSYHDIGSSSHQGLYSQVPNYVGFSQDMSASWPSMEELEVNNCNNKSLSTTSSYDNDHALDENRLPPLVSSSREANSSINHIESTTTSSNGGSTLTPSDDHFLEGWENLLDNRNGGSFWKDFIK